MASVLDWPTTELGFDEFDTTVGDVITTTFRNRELLPQGNETTNMKAQLMAYDILIPLLGALIIVTNAAVVVSSGLLLKKGQQPRCTYLLLGNVAMADLVTGIAVIFGQSFPKTSRTHNICSLQLGMIVSSTLASIYSVGLIAVDRFLYILYGLKYHHWVYPTRARCMIAATWLLGLVIGFLPLMGWAGDTDNGRVCWFIVLAPKHLVIFTTVVGFIPVLLVIVLYSIILYNAIKKVIQLKKMGEDNAATEEHNTSNMRMFRGGTVSKAQNSTVKKPAIKTVSATMEEGNKDNEGINNEDVVTFKEIIYVHAQPEPSRWRKLVDRIRKIGRGQGKREYILEDNKKPGNPTKWKAIKVVFFTTGSFVCTWLPYFVACSIYVFCDFQTTPQRCQRLKFAIASPLAILGFLNSLLNPLIYAWWHNGFRKSIKKLCCRKRNARNQDLGESKKPYKSSKSSQTTSSHTFEPQTNSDSK